MYDVTPGILGERRRTFGSPGPHSLGQRFPRLAEVSSFVRAPQRLAENEPDLFTKVCTPSADRTAMLPDGTVLDAAEAAAGRLGVEEMRRQLERIRRDYADDPEALVGQVKELIETTCKTILGLTGSGPETKQDVPALVDRALRHLGVHPASFAGDDPAEVRALKQMFGGMSSVLMGMAELRNFRGTGHGRSGAPLIDGAAGRAAAGLVMAVTTYLCDLYEARLAEGAVLGEPSAPEPSQIRGLRQWEPGMPLEIGDTVVHPSFGTGQLVHSVGSGDKRVATVDFENGVGEKRLLLRYAPINVFD